MPGTDHYFSEDPGSTPRSRLVPVELDGRTVELRTTGGTFSPHRLDPGTALLLSSLPDPAIWPTGPVLDLGCGAGALAVAVALRDPAREVWAVDVNPRARADCRHNAANLGAEVSVVAPDEAPADLRFAVVVSNPPIRIGKDALHDLLEHWLGRLQPDGEAWLVVSRHLGADSLGTWITSLGRNVERVRSRRGYRVLRVH